MKKLSDYVGDEAIDLWSDLLDPLSVIMSDKEIAEIVRSKTNRITVAKTILSKHKAETEQILLRIDPEPITGLNIITRLMSILADIGSDSTIRSFFGYAEQVKTGDESGGSVTEITEESQI